MPVLNFTGVDEVIVLFKERVIFKQYISKKHKHFGIDIYKLCSTTSSTYKIVYKSFWTGFLE